MVEVKVTTVEIETLIADLKNLQARAGMSNPTSIREALDRAVTKLGTWQSRTSISSEVKDPWDHGGWPRRNK